MIDGQFTLGVEEEYQIVHPETRDLRSYVSRLIEDGKSILRERVRPEMHQSMVEVGTGICKDVGAVSSELREMRGDLDKLARKGGLRIAAASTHPFADWKTQDITDGELRIDGRRVNDVAPRDRAADSSPRKRRDDTYSGINQGAAIRVRDPSFDRERGRE